MKREMTDAEIEAALRSQSAPLPDDGFTLRVMHALPQSDKTATRPAAIAPVRFPWIAFIATAVVAILAFIWAFAPSAFPAGSSVESALGSDPLIDSIGRLGSGENLASISLIALVMAVLYFLDGRETSPE